MKAKELASKYNITFQYIQAITKDAADKQKEFVTLNGTNYSFELRREGRGRPAYFYEELKKAKVVKRSINTSNLNIELSTAKKEKLDLKLKIVTGFNSFKKAGRGGVKEYVEYIQKKHDESYTQKKHYDWRRDYRKEGARALIDKRGRKKGETLKLSEEQQRFLIKYFRAFGAGEINYTQLWEELHRHEEKINDFDFMAWKQNKLPNLCDRGTVQRFITNYYETRVIEWTLVTKGEDLNKSYNQPAMGKRAETYTKKNECWEIDSTPADVIIFHENQQIRPDILAIKDAYSGRCVAILAIKSNSLAIIRLLWKAIETLGIPKMIKGDNGRDYVSEQFQGLLHNLGIRYEKATAYAGDEKGMVERNFRTLQHSYMRVLAGFIGHNVAHRQKIEQQTAKKHRKAKDEFGNMAKTQTASSELLSWDELDDKLQEAICLWEIDKKRRTGPSPIELWNNCFEDIEMMDYENFLVYAGGYTQRTVQKEGINYDGRKYISSFIHKYRGQKVWISENIDNMSEVFVFDNDGYLIGTCVDADISPMKKEDFIKVKREFAKEVSTLQRAIKDDKSSARSKSTINDDYKRAVEVHKDSLKPSNVVHLDNSEIKEKSKNEEMPVFDDMATVVVTTVDSSEEKQSIYSDFAIEY